jgi:hypothetical protein
MLYRLRLLSFLQFAITLPLQLNNLEWIHSGIDMIDCGACRWSVVVMDFVCFCGVVGES